MKRFLGAMLLCIPVAAWGMGTVESVGTGHHHEGSTTTVQNGLQMQCDVMRDYEYVHDTGEFIGWLGGTYLANCVSIGNDGSTDNNPCAPGDLDCQCTGADAPFDPMCGGADPCADGMSSKADECGPPKTPPKKYPKCATCIANLAKQKNQVKTKKETCKDLFAWPIAADHCNAGELRKPEGGFYTNFALERYLDQHNAIQCVDIGNSAICEVMPEWSECMMGWLDGTMHQTVMEHGGINTTTGTLNGNFPMGSGTVNMGSIQGVHSQQDPTHTYDLPAGAGLNGVCQAEADAGNTAAWANFKACSKTAPDHVGQGANAICPAPNQQGPGGTN